LRGAPTACPLKAGLNEPCSVGIAVNKQNPLTQQPFEAICFFQKY
jgi:hypothetical protein